MSVGVVTYVSWIASSIDASTVSANAGARRAPPRRHRTERGERADDVLAEPAADRQRRQVHVPVRGETPAARLQHLFGEVEAVVGTTVTERGDRHRDERLWTRGRRRPPVITMSAVSSHDVGAGRAPLRGPQVGEQRIVADRSREHDVGAEVGEELGAVRARDTRRAVDDAQTVVDHASANIGTITDLSGTVVNASGRNVDRDRRVGDELIGRRVDDVRAEPDRGIFVERDQRGDERDPILERREERAAHDRPREQRAPPRHRGPRRARRRPRGHTSPGYHTYSPQDSQRGISSSPRAAPAKKAR